MSWRIINITRACDLRVKHSQLLYKTEEEEISLPLEDISIIILENAQIVLSNYLISECAERNIVIFTCDKSHKPNGVFLPYYNHSRYSEVSYMQIYMSQPLKKRLWQLIIISKIENQAKILQNYNIKTSDFLLNLSEKVQSGDVTNVEAQAAVLYWGNLFETKFKRHNCDIINSALDYGYAILRGAIAREVAASGLIPCLGVHHSNKLNAFNLVDDLIEPFRPVVDALVKEMNLADEVTLTSQKKVHLIGALTREIFINKESVKVMTAIERFVKSFVRSLRHKNAKDLTLPKIKDV